MANQDAEKNKTTRRSREEQTDAGQFEVSRPAARPRRNPRPDTTQGEFEVSRPAARPRSNPRPDATQGEFEVSRPAARPRSNPRPDTAQGEFEVSHPAARPRSNPRPDTTQGEFEVSRPAARSRRNPRPDAAQGQFEVSRPAARSRARGEKSANAVLDRTGNRYHVNREREAREEEQDEKMREHIRRREEIEEAASLFTRKTEATGYPYWLSLLVTTFKLFLICVLIIGFSGVGFVLGMAKSYLDTVPELDFSVVQEQDQSTLLYDVNGQFLGNYYNSENRDWATLDEIPDELENAVIAIEDSRFRRHMGIDPKRIFGVLLSNLFSGSQQGGSTITQQLIKNTILSFEQTYKRKIQEAALALEMERKYSKDQILEAYLNTIYMGGSCYGVKTAAMDYFGKNVNELSLRECACLAGMIQNPSRYNPRTNYYTRSNPARTDNRTNLVLYEMRRNGLVTQEEYDAARQDTLSVQEKSPYTAQKEMVYFTDYVIDSIVDEILSDRGMENNAANRTRIRKEIRTEGYRIYTTMDADKQRAAEEAVYAYDNFPAMRYSTDTYTVAGRNPDGSVIRLVQPQCAMAIVDYRNGYITALIGGRQAPTGSMQFNRSYQSTMPVGSSIKPLAVYGPAIEKGSGAGTVYYDYQMKIEGWDSVNGYPANNSRSYSGRTTMRRAFVQSLNVTAAQALMYDVGLDDAYNTLVNLGVEPSHISKTGSGLALGSSGITPLEMAGAYSAIANMGEYIQPIAFTRVEDHNGNVILDMLSKQQRRRVFSESTAWQITNLMRDVATSNSRTNVPGQTVYGKTGTNSDNRGVFFAGFTGYYVGCVWIGSDAYKPLTSSAQGGVYGAPLFAAVMTEVHKGLPNKPANSVDPASIGVQKVEYCDHSGKLATEACPSKHTDYGCPEKMEPCDLHRHVTICKTSGMLATEFCPESERETATIILVPQRGLLHYMYYNENNRFISLIGTPVTSMSSCKLHTQHDGQNDSTPDAGENEG